MCATSFLDSLRLMHSLYHNHDYDYDYDCDHDYDYNYKHTLGFNEDHHLESGILLPSSCQ